MVSWKFSRITNTISEQKISRVTDRRVCFTWSLSSQAAGYEYTLFVCIWSRHLKLWLRKWSLTQMFLKKHSLYNLNWSCFDHTCTVASANITMPCCVTAVGLSKLSTNQWWVNLVFSVLRDSILDGLFSILDSRRNRELQVESRMETHNRLSAYFWTVLYLFGGAEAHLHGRMTSPLTPHPLAKSGHIFLATAREGQPWQKLHWS